ncbi:MAG: ATP synthase F1 subunit gamma [Candidatus Aminicenantes bacterium]|nr:ATP synthase F1 subunit gamma [Candidatus Aminicenantes bacterium]
MTELIELRRRVKSVKNTQQITKAMKTVASAKFKKAQRNVLEGRPYWHNYPELISSFVAQVKKTLHPLMETREEKKILVLVFTSDKGLAGALNSNLLEEAFDFLEKKAEKCAIQLILLGKKAVVFFRRYDFEVIKSYSGRMQKFTDEDLQEITDHIVLDHILVRSDAVYVVYNEFKSILRPKPSIAKVLPIEGDQEEEGTEKILYDWEPGEDKLVQTLLPFYVRNQIQHFYFESIASEHAARMMAMENATKNAEDLIKDLTLKMNKIRQASITKELLEIMSAVDALKK